MSSSSSLRICFNSDCTSSLRSESSRKGWRLRSGDYAELCDRCATAYEEGRFCETCHVNSSGWRHCESCGKRVHCGCIVSFQTFIMLDAGGIECIQCARKNVILTPNPVWQPPPLAVRLPLPLPERLKDLSVKNWSQISGAGPVPWRQAPSLFSTPTSQYELNSRTPYEVDLATSIDRLGTSERLAVSSHEKKKIEDSSDKSMNGILKLGASEIRENGNAGMNYEEQFVSRAIIPRQLASLKDDPSTMHFGFSVPSAPINEKNGQVGDSGTHSRPTPSPLLSKQFHGNNGVDSSGESQIRNGRPRGDGRGKNQLLSRYWPRITGQELQQLSGDPNSIITPLFEKMLSASDAGRIGRLVLPKKCAEAYFPPISNPEGLPLQVQDMKGTEWVFQFRFWPNNNSRMYVLEGVTPCIQSMQLQAGDIVTFSRLEPEGKLVMGFRKASTAPSSDQGSEINKTANGISTHADAELVDPARLWSKVDKSGYIAKEVPGAKSPAPRKRKNSTLGSKNKRLRMDNMDLIELKITWEEAQGLLRPPSNHLPSVVIIEGLEFEEYEDAPVIGKPTIFTTDLAGEKIQWVQCEDCSKWRKLPADALLPPRWTCSQNSWDTERSLCSAAQEINAEQLEDLLPANNLAGSKKMEAATQDSDALEALEGLDTLANLAILEVNEAIPLSSQATTKHPRHKPGCTCIVCIQPPSGKGPKHKQTCTCNVCVTVKRRFRTLMMRRERKQSEKEEETARRNQLQSPETLLLEDTTLCSNMENSSSNLKETMKRHIKALMTREVKHSEKLLDSPLKKHDQLQSPENLLDDGPTLCGNMENSSLNLKEANEGSDDDPNRKKSSSSPFKGQIDLNIQPEREEELSPGSDSGGMMRLLQEATEKYLRQQRLLTSSGNMNSTGSETQLGEGFIAEEKFSNHVKLSTNNHQDTDVGVGHPVTSSMNESGSTSAT